MIDLKEIIQEQHGLRFLGMIVKALMANNAYHNIYPWSKTCLFQNFLRFLMISSIKDRLKISLASRLDITRNQQDSQVSVSMTYPSLDQ